MSEERKVLLEVRKLKKIFPIKRNVQLKALNDVSFKIYEGEKFGVVGESGCGKSTLGRVLLQLHKQTSGSTVYHGKSVEDVNPAYMNKEIKNLTIYQKKARDFYQASLKIDREVDNLLLQRESIDVLGSENDTKRYDQLSRKIDKLQYDSKELRKNASRQLREGSRTIGSLILSSHLEEIQKQYAEAQKISEKVHQLLKERKVLDAKTQKKWIESEKNIDDRVKRNEAEQLKQQLSRLDAKLDEYRVQVKTIKKQTYQNYKGKDYLPITEQTLDPKYQQKLDANYETGLNLAKLSSSEMKPIRREMQMIFQDPAASLDPRQSIGSAIEEVFKINTKYSKEVRQEKTIALLEKVGLKAEYYDTYPHALSGGQKQRVGIARAIALNTNFVVLDEAVSALDVSVQAQILQLLNKLSDEFKLTYFFITHDLGVVKHFCDRILVMYLGSACELADSKTLFNEPLHPYTQSLLEAVPRPRIQGEIKRDTIQGEVPSPINQPKGCPFHTRCKFAMDVCKTEKPVYHEAKPNHFVARQLFEENVKA